MAAQNPDRDPAPVTFAGNGLGNTVANGTQRYLCPFGPNATLQSDWAMAEIIVQHKDVLNNFTIKITSAQPVGNEGLWFQLIINGNVVSRTNVVGPGAAAGTYDADFPDGPYTLNIGDRLCIGVLNTGASASAKLGAFGLG